MLEHLSYSLDLTLSDFHLLGLLKNIWWTNISAMMQKSNRRFAYDCNNNKKNYTLQDSRTHTALRQACKFRERIIWKNEQWYQIGISYCFNDINFCNLLTLPYIFNILQNKSLLLLYILSISFFQCSKHILKSPSFRDLKDFFLLYDFYSVKVSSSERWF